MAKLTLKTTCERTVVTKQGSNAMFVIESEKLPPAAPGQPPIRTARTLIQFNFNNDTAKQFVPDKKYSITIE